MNDYPPIRFEIRFERKFPIADLYFLTLLVQTLWNLCPVEKLFGMRMAGCVSFTDALVYDIFHWGRNKKLNCEREKLSCSSLRIFPVGWSDLIVKRRRPVGLMHWLDKLLVWLTMHVCYRKSYIRFTCHLARNLFLVDPETSGWTTQWSDNNIQPAKRWSVETRHRPRSFEGAWR